MLEAAMAGPRKYILKKGELFDSSHSLDEGVSYNEVFKMGNVDSPMNIFANAAGDFHELSVS
jgi:hypothetical protein